MLLLFLLTVAILTSWSISNHLQSAVYGGDGNKHVTSSPQNNKQVVPRTNRPAQKDNVVVNTQYSSDIMLSSTLGSTSENIPTQKEGEDVLVFESDVSQASHSTLNEELEYSLSSITTTAIPNIKKNNDASDKPVPATESVTSTTMSFPYGTDGNVSVSDRSSGAMLSTATGSTTQNVPVIKNPADEPDLDQSEVKSSSTDLSSTASSTQGKTAAASDATNKSGSNVEQPSDSSSLPSNTPSTNKHDHNTTSTHGAQIFNGNSSRVIRTNSTRNDTHEGTHSLDITSSTTLANGSSTRDSQDKVSSNTSLSSDGIKLNNTLHMVTPAMVGNDTDKRKAVEHYLPLSGQYRHFGNTSFNPLTAGAEYLRVFIFY